MGAIPEDKSDGSISAKIDTPEGGFKRVDVVDNGLVPIKSTLEAKTSFTNSVKSSCINTRLLNAFLANPERWVYKRQTNGEYELSTK